MSCAGIIANPASGKDIRRLVAHGSTFDNNEKINIVRRVLLAMDALGVEQVHYMPDGYAIVQRAAETVRISLRLVPLPMVALGMASDSLEAARRMADLGVGCLVTLGGDGTNRMVAKGCGDVPLVPISTGTNNVFPSMVEGTLAGMAAGLIATGAVSRFTVANQAPWLDLWLDDRLADRALIDVVTAHQRWIGARALWDPAQIAEVVLSRVTAAEIGMCCLGGLLFPHASGSARGVHIVLGQGGRTVLAPLAPGLLRTVTIAEACLLEQGDRVSLRSTPCTVALDGERELEIPRAGHQLAVSLNPAGPWVVNIKAALQAGAENASYTESRTK